MKYLSLIIILLILSCKSDPVENSDKQAALQSITIPASLPINGLVPPIYDSLNSFELSSMLFEGLFDYDKNSDSFQYNLIDNHFMDSTLTTYTFTLSNNISLSKNQGFLNSSDVINSLRYYLEYYKSKNRSSPFIQLLKIQADDSSSWYTLIDKHNFKLHLKTAFSELPELLSHPDLWIYRKIVKDGKINYLGSGPFYYSSDNQSFIIKQDSKDENMHSLKTLIIKPVYYSDNENELRDFVNGNLAILKNPPIEIAEDWYEEHLENNGKKASKYQLVNNPKKYLYYIKFATNSEIEKVISVKDGILTKLNNQLNLFNIYLFINENDTADLVNKYFKTINRQNQNKNNAENNLKEPLEMYYQINDQYAKTAIDVLSESEGLRIKSKAVSPEIMKGIKLNKSNELLIDRIDLDFTNKHDLNYFFTKKTRKLFNENTKYTDINAFPLFVVDENIFVQPYIKNFSDRNLQYRNLSVVYLDTIETLKAN